MAEKLAPNRFVSHRPSEEIHFFTRAEPKDIQDSDIASIPSESAEFDKSNDSNRSIKNVHSLKREIPKMALYVNRKDNQKHLLNLSSPGHLKPQPPQAIGAKSRKQTNTTCS